MYYITVSNGLLEPKHYEKMRVNQKTSCIWVYLWLLDKMTKIDLETGLGKVLGGKPIKVEELKRFGDRKTIMKILSKLEIEGYIKTIRTPYGKSISVTKAKKSFGWQPKRSPQSGTPEVHNLVHLREESGTSNKTVQYDSTIDISTSSKEEDATNNKRMIKNKMGSYNENKHSDNFEDSIDIETGELARPLEPKRQKAINYIKDYFSAKCEKLLKIKPMMTFKQNIIIANLFKKGMKPSEITDVIDWYFATERDRTKLIHIGFCLSAHNINTYKISK